MAFLGLDVCPPGCVRQSSAAVSLPRRQVGHSYDVNKVSNLNWIQRGGTEAWKRLYQLRKDPSVARSVAAILPQRKPDLLALALL
jgi:hypothetical protein